MVKIGFCLEICCLNSNLENICLKKIWGDSKYKIVITPSLRWQLFYLVGNIGNIFINEMLYFDDSLNSITIKEIISTSNILKFSIQNTTIIITINSETNSFTGMIFSPASFNVKNS